jgi:glycosidase
VRVLVAALSLLVVLVVPSALASHTPAPATVTLVGSLQSELGCVSDWDPGCAATNLTFDATDGVWQRSWTVPAGAHEYKTALNGSWDENYGANAQPGGANVELLLEGNVAVKFYYDHGTHWITDNRNTRIVTAPGSFQSELGCPGDWQPDCLRSWLQDPDGDGTFTFQTDDLPAGNYEAKATIDEAWDENYGAGGEANGPNVAFTVPANAVVTFSFVSDTNVLSITTQTTDPAPDDNVEWDGVKHDSRDELYRSPGGAVPSGTDVKLRLRTFHDDVTGASLRLYDVEANSATLVPMELAAAGVDCYGVSGRTCDFWEATVSSDVANNYWYRFVVTDGSDTDYYADGTPALDGGPGRMTDDPVDWSWALMFHVPGFEAPDWVADAVIYQIFPDRFRNGTTRNDPRTGDVRYDDPVLKLPWGAPPEGYCRNYQTDDASCPWRFDTTPPDWSPNREGPRGRDYMGGDLLGVQQKLPYLRDLGVTAIYFNPIFEARSNHRYDTAEYKKIDRYLGANGDWANLVRAARNTGWQTNDRIRLILDGVFNHMSSDSPRFDRYHHSSTVGGCESLSSEYRDWYAFLNDDVPCGLGDYEGWFGFDSIPVLTKSNPEVLDYFLHDDRSVVKEWIVDGARGWRYDVSGDASFPRDYWIKAREEVKSQDSSVVTIGETWQKDSALLRSLRGDQQDTTMNYRLRDAVLGLLAPGPFDTKGFADSGRQLEPSEFAARLLSIREDLADASWFSLMNLLDSHDTERILWTLTPGAETPAAKEHDAANVAAGKARLRLASLIQFSLPGAPTVYYGDEVGLTGDDDPDDRRTYPWADTGGSPDNAMLAHYKALTGMRKGLEPLRRGELRMLLANDADDTLAYGLRTGTRAAVVALNRSSSVSTLRIPVAGFMPDGPCAAQYAVNTPSAGGAAVGGVLELTLQPWGGIVCATGTVDLEAPPAPASLAVTGEGNGSVSLGWSAVAGATGYDVYRSPLSGGGYVMANAAPVTGTSFTDTGLENARSYYYVVRALDAAGNESEPSNEVVGLPHLAIGWANLQWPPSMTHVISVTDRTDGVYGQVWIDGETSKPGPTPGLTAELGFGPDGSDPSAGGWTWVPAAFNVDAGNNDEFVASLLPESTGTFDYAYRYSTTGGREWTYADLDGIGNGYSPSQAGSLTVESSGDTTAPAAPTGLRATGASPSSISLAWNAFDGDASLWGYEVWRGEASGGPYARLARLTGTSYTDVSVREDATYWYVVRALDGSFNRSAPSNEVSATAERRLVSVTFALTVPAPVEDAVGRSVYIAGTLNRLEGGLPEWNPGGVVLTKVDDTHWTVTLQGEEGTQLEYKYVLGAWEYVEKDGACGEIPNRMLTLAYGSDGTQTVGDAAVNWRNVEPCGN